MERSCKIAINSGLKSLWKAHNCVAIFVERDDSICATITTSRNNVVLSAASSSVSKCLFEDHPRTLLHVMMNCCTKYFLLKYVQNPTHTQQSSSSQQSRCKRYKIKAVEVVKEILFISLIKSVANYFPLIGELLHLQNVHKRMLIGSSPTLTEKRNYKNNNSSLDDKLVST